METGPAYGLWPLVIVNSALFIIFAFSFTKPKSARDWRSLGAFSAFVLALFTEMYGFPLTIYLLSGWLAQAYPEADLFSHDAGHLWSTAFGAGGNPHFGVLHLLSNGLIVAGFIVVARAWPVLHRAQASGTLATTGIYAHIRHPQYVGFILVLIGFFLQWPTLPTAVMLPVLIVMYIRLARREEQEAVAAFGADYLRYAARVPGFIPRWRARDTHGAAR